MEAWFEEYIVRVEEELAYFFDTYGEYVSKFPFVIKDLLAKIRRYSLAGGKRIRPILTILAYYGYGGKGDKIKQISIVPEILHNYYIIHDDIIDQDHIRRGIPTVHAMYEHEEDSKHHALSMAICAGDFTSHMVNHIIINSEFSNKIKLEVLKLIDITGFRTIIGQVLDVCPEESASWVEEVHTLKTAHYTISNPLKLGAILAGVKKSELKKIERYSMFMGKAFQLQDDILGLFGDEESIGKPIGSDIQQGKMTLLVVKALELASKKDVKFLRACLGKHNLSKKDLIKVRGIITDSGALQYSTNLIDLLLTKSLVELEKLNLNEPQKEQLRKISRFIVGRAH